MRPLTACTDEAVPVNTWAIDDRTYSTDTSLAISKHIHFINFQQIHPKTTCFALHTNTTKADPNICTWQHLPTKWRLKVELKEGLVQTVGMQDKTPWCRARLKEWYFPFLAMFVSFQVVQKRHVYRYLSK